MAENLAMNMVENIIPDRVGDISILLIDDDITSIASLTSMLETFSYKVMSVKVANEAESMIEKQKDIGLVMANIELPHIGSHSFLNLLLQKDIPLILISPEIMTKETSDLLTKASVFCLKKPIFENDIKNLLQHVLHKKKKVYKKFNIADKQKSVMNEETKQIEAFRENLKRQRISQASLLGKRKIMKTFIASEMYEKRKIVENVEWNPKPVCPIEIEEKKEKKVESNVGRRCNLWTYERHMKFLAAISILGEKSFRPKSILKIMNDPNLTHRQVASHLQKYKVRTERINSRNEWRSTEKTFIYPSDYEYPFKASNLTKNVIESNTLWHSLRKKKASSSSISQFVFKKPVAERDENMPNFLLGGKLDLSNPLPFGNILNKSSMEASSDPSTTSNNPSHSIPFTNDVNHSAGLVSTGFSSDKLPDISGLPSSVSASNTDTVHMETERICFPNLDPKPMQPSTSVFDSERNPIDLDPISSLSLNLVDTNMDQMDWVPSTEDYVLPETDMNSIALETNTNQMGGAISREGYVPSENMISSEINIDQMGGVSYGENYVLPQGMIFAETNTTHLDYVSCEIPPETNIPILETNTDQMNWVFSEESYVLPMTSCETNTTQVGLVPCETSYAALDNVIPLETNMEEMGLVPNEEGYDVPIEDLISFDIDANEIYTHSWLENYGNIEGNIHLSTSNLVNDSALNTPIDLIPHTTVEDQDNPLPIPLGSTSLQHNMESCEYQNIEGMDAVYDCEFMDWLDEVLNED